MFIKVSYRYIWPFRSRDVNVDLNTFDLFVLNLRVIKTDYLITSILAFIHLSDEFK